jgi:two-component system, cell cycle sensor histidine kinase and response regulator CckA
MTEVPREENDFYSAFAAGVMEDLPAAGEMARAVVDTVREPLLILDENLIVQSVNKSFCRVFRVSSQETLGRLIYDLGDGQWDIPTLRTLLEEILPMNSSFEDFEVEKDFPGLGHKIMLLNARRLIPRDTQGHLLLLAIEDVTERKWAERYHRLFETAQDGILMLEVATGKIIEANPYLANLMGISPEELKGKELWEIGIPENIPASRRTFQQLQETGYSRFEDQPIRARNGQSLDVEFICNVYKVGDGKMAQCNIRDIGVRKRAEEALRESEEKLRQSQKVEAIGKLAGGIAHDFNNLLTAINGYGTLCLAQAEPQGPLHDNLVEILKAGERAAALTRQLLAYSRQQVLAPRVLNLNTIVTEMRNMLMRVIGENIELASVLDPGLGLVKADPSQMEQIFLNLVINSRDAMLRGGKITLETRNTELDWEYSLRHPMVAPGPYVQVSVSDTGVGMDPEVKSRIFDPFFTTKGAGKGTGLGLSMVYGIIAQSGGHISVYSEPGMGTSFKIYLPRVPAGTASLPDRRVGTAVTAQGGTETVLVVEDEAMVRQFARKVIEMQGYQVLEAPDGNTALALSKEHHGPIHLLLTDVVLPGMNGREIADRFLQARPESRVVFMSGYTDNAAIRHGILAKGTHFLQKPFTAAQLGKVLREVLDALASAQAK